MPWWFFDLDKDFFSYLDGTLIAVITNHSNPGIAEDLKRIVMRDSEVEQHVLRSLALDSAIAGREICVESQAGVVTLSGTSPSYHGRSAIHEATRSTPGVCGVVNRIEVEVAVFLIAEMPPGANTSAPPLKLMASA